MNSEVTRAFPTILVRTAWDDSDALNAGLARLILSREQRGGGGVEQGGWHSDLDLHAWNEPEIVQLRDRMGSGAKAWVAASLERPVDSFRARIRVAAWANVSREGQYGRPHIHTNSNATGVYYVDPGGPTRPDAGTLQLLDPRPGAVFHNVLSEHSNLLGISPAAGEMLVFPSWLWHSIDAFFGERPRISVAFTLVVEQLVDTDGRIDQVPGTLVV